jgi:tRNA(Ile)-lysidine synthase
MTSLTELVERTARCFARYENLGAAPAVLAAVSGGVDSTVLAVVLARLAAAGRLPGPLVLAHVDHRQHEFSSHAGEHVARLSRQLGAGYLLRQLQDVAPHASEDELRQRRYAALQELAVECDAGFVVTAHHADDDVETVLFRLLRGTGVRGLAGIPEHRALGPRLHLLRPFLEVRRSQLEQLAGQERLPVFDDPTNRDTRYARNALRHELIPELRAKVGSSNLDASLFALARTAKATAALLDAQARRILTQRGRQANAWRATVDLRGLGTDDRVFLREALTQLDARLRAPEPGSSPAVLERVLDELWLGRCGQRVHGLGAGALLYERTREGLLIVDPARAGPPPDHSIPLALGGLVAFGATEWQVGAVPHPEPPLDPSPSAAGPLRALLDPERVPPPWFLRTRRSGDRLTPLGLDREVELRRYQQSQHVPRFDRDRLPVVVDSCDRVLWAPGATLSARAALRPTTSVCIELNVQTR